MLLKHPDQACVGIDEAAALVVVGDRVRTVSGDGKAGCVLKRVVDSKIQAFSFTEQHGEVPLEDFLKAAF